MKSTTLLFLLFIFTTTIICASIRSNDANKPGLDSLIPIIARTASAPEGLKPPILIPNRVLCAPRQNSPLLDDVNLAVASFTATCNSTDPPKMIVRGCQLLAFHNDAVISMCGLSGAQMMCGDMEKATTALEQEGNCNNAGHVGGHMEFAWGIIIVARSATS